MPGCGDGGGGAIDASVDAPGSGKSLVDFLPALPAPDHAPQSVFAGAITQADGKELIPGPAQSGMVGDYFMRNARVRFVIESPERVIGVVPWGGNVVDAVAIGADGKDVTADHLGEISMVYLLGRTCAHDKVEVLRDGSQGGPAVVRATGKSAVNDYVNLRGFGGPLSVPEEIDPDIGDRVECATTYTLEPDSDTLHIAWTLFNPGPLAIAGPFGLLNDMGGEVELFQPRLGFQGLGGSLANVLDALDAAVPYAIYQGPGVSYGLIPRLAEGEQSAGIVIAGVSVLIFKVKNFLEVTQREKDSLHLAVGGGVTNEADLVIGTDGAATEAAFRRRRGAATVAITGKVSYAPSAVPVRARVTVFHDADGNGAVDAGDPVVTYFDTDTTGAYRGSLAAGSYLLRADIPDTARSAPKTVVVAVTAVATDFTLAEPAIVDYTVTDAEDPEHKPMPVKITVVGRSPVARDARVEEPSERRAGLLRTLHAPHGTSVAPGADASDSAVLLPAGTAYRIYFSRGPEWSVESFKVEAVAGARTVLPTVQLRRVVDTDGYVATAFHEHAVGSPDSAVGFKERLASLVSEGTEFFASTDHDHLSDYTPFIRELGLEGKIQGVVGVEATPFAYGHFNAYPLDIDDSDPTGGAVDWGQGAKAGFAMLPSEIWDAYRQRGAKVVQLCHPRSYSVSSFQGYFWRAGLVFDFVARTVTGDAQKQDVPNDWLRLPPEVSLFSDQFDVIETWIQFGHADTDRDGIPEQTTVDRVLQDWMNFLSLGKVYTPLGNADTHTRERDQSGLPRTLVRVPDDSSDALRAGIDEDVWATLLGTTPRDVVVTDGPMLHVSEQPGGASALGRIVAAVDGVVTLDITASSADWVDFDTVEVFANNTFDALPPSGVASSLPPVACFTARTGLGATDPCKLAPWRGGAQPLTVQLETLPNGGVRRVARVSATFAASDIPTRAGHTGSDAWFVVRVRGNRGLVPVIIEDAITDANVATFVENNSAAVAAALEGRGASALAFTSPIFVDFDGGGYRAPFAP